MNMQAEMENNVCCLHRVGLVLVSLFYRCSYRLHCDMFLDTAQVRVTCCTTTAFARSHWSSNVAHDSPERFKAHAMQTFGRLLETLEKPLGNPWKNLEDPWGTLGKHLGNPRKPLENP